MGYDLHITRQKSWLDDNDLLKISLEEWIKYVDGDPDMQFDNLTEVQFANDNIERIESTRLSVWTKYSGDGKNGNRAWFNYCNGLIIVKNPDNEIINKMIGIAAYMNANVQGEEGEFYICSAYGKIARVQNTSDLTANKKKWWKLW